MRSLRFWDVMQHRLIVTDVLGQPVGAIFKGQAVTEESLTLEDGNANLSRNIGNKLAIYSA